jgi:hypothetical protein
MISYQVADTSVGSLAVKKTFASDGKWRQIHEQSHDPPVNIQEQPLLTEIHEEVTSDDMYNYQKALMEYGMVI